MFGVRFDLARLVRHMQREIKACVATSVRAVWPAALAGAKISGKYLSLVWAREEARRLGCDEAIILDDTDHVAEASTANLFAVKDGVLATPSVTPALPGITRATVIELAGGLGVRVEERAIHRDELWEADEIFLTNTAHGVVGLRELAGGWRSRGRKLTEEVRRVYLEVLEGRDARHADWLTRVDADA
jgi:branched-chain amino acid aminotransferase